MRQDTMTTVIDPEKLRQPGAPPLWKYSTVEQRKALFALVLNDQARHKPESPGRDGRECSMHGILKRIRDEVVGVDAEGRPLTVIRALGAPQLDGPHMVLKRFIDTAYDALREREQLRERLAFLDEFAAGVEIRKGAA
jgi:hypothetical protein